MCLCQISSPLTKQYLVIRYNQFLRRVAGASCGTLKNSREKAGEEV